MHRLLPPSPPVIHSTGTAHLVAKRVLEPADLPGGDSWLPPPERLASLRRLEALMTATVPDRETTTLVNNRSRHVVRFEDRRRDKGGFATSPVVLVTGNGGPDTCPAPRVGLASTGVVPQSALVAIVRPSRRRHLINHRGISRRTSGMRIRSHRTIRGRSPSADLKRIVDPACLSSSTW